MKQPIWTISINGQTGDEYSSTIPVMDRGFLFGDSIFEVTTTLNGVLMFWNEHFERLQNSANGVDLPLTWSAESLFQEIKKVVTTHRLQMEYRKLPVNDIYVRFHVTRGFTAKMGLYQDHPITPNLVIMVQTLQSPSSRMIESGIRLHLAEKIYRNSRRTTDPNLKTGNYLNSILAMQEAKRLDFDDVILQNLDGMISEGSNFNIWGIKNNTLITTPLESGILLGTTRRAVIALAQAHSIRFSEKTVSPSELRQMDELFVTSAVRGVLPVAQLDDVYFPVEKQSMTRRLMGLFEEFRLEHARAHSQWRTHESHL